MNINPLPPFQQRVVAERDELQDRAQKLDVFVNHTPSFVSVEPQEQERLKQQLSLQQQLLIVLNDRIAHF